MTVKRSTILSRRRALSGAATVGIGIPLLAACGDDSTDATSADTSATNSDTSAGSSDTSAGSSDTSAGSSDTSAGEGIPTADVPVGGGIVLTDEQVVVTQPTEGEFRAFTAICTHAGCPVARVSTEIECDCHASRFSIEDGSVVGGPAPAPLAEADFEVAGDRITLA